MRNSGTGRTHGQETPVLERALTNHYVVGFLLLLAAAKIVAASLTIGIGGSGGVFAPSLVIGGTLGMAIGIPAQHLLGPGAAPAGALAVAGMAAVFAGAAKAPLTGAVTVLEMSGNLGLVLPVMLAVAVAAAISHRLSYGSIYTTKLLRRGIDIDRPRPATLLQTLTVADAMGAVPEEVGPERVIQGLLGGLGAHGAAPGGPGPGGPGPAAAAGAPQALFANETLQQALRQLVLYGRRGLPVLAPDGDHVVGWLTNHDVMQAFSRRVESSAAEARAGVRAAEFAVPPGARSVRRPPDPLRGFRVIGVRVEPGTALAGRYVREVSWPPGALVVAVQRDGAMLPATGATQLAAGDQLTVLTPAAQAPAVAQLGRLDSPPEPGPRG